MVSENCLRGGYQNCLQQLLHPQGALDSRAWVNSVRFPLSEKSKTGTRSTNLLCFCLLASEIISNLDLFSLWVSLWEFPSLLGKLFPDTESPLTQKQLPWGRSWPDCWRHAALPDWGHVSPFKDSGNKSGLVEDSENIVTLWLTGRTACF